MTEADANPRVGVPADAGAGVLLGADAQPPAALSAVWVNGGKALALDLFRQELDARGWLTLWVNDVVPAQGFIWGNLTEASFLGYQRQKAAPWSAPSLAFDGDESVDLPPQYFVNEGPTAAQAWGWALVRVVGSVVTLLLARRFDVVLTIPSARSFKLSVSLRDRSLFGGL